MLLNSIEVTSPFDTKVWHLLLQIPLELPLGNCVNTNGDVSDDTVLNILSIEGHNGNGRVPAVGCLLRVDGVDVVGSSVDLRVCNVRVQCHELSAKILSHFG